MSTDDAARVLLDDPSPSPRYAEAARLLERALQVGRPDPDVAYLLALAYKRQGKTAEARAALRKIARPDAAVWLQLGLLSLRERQLAQAESEFARAWELGPDSYPACYNLLFTRLTLGQLDACRELLPRAHDLAPTPEERRFVALLQLLLDAALAGSLVDPAMAAALAELSPDDEARLLGLVRSLGTLDVSQSLLQTLVAARPESDAVVEAHAEVVLVRAKGLMDRGEWLSAERLLLPLTRQKGLPRGHQALLLNLLGICCCLNQDFDEGARHLSQAVKLVPTDPRLSQNLALAHEMQNQAAQAEPHWNRYFDLLLAGADLPRPPGQPDYHDRLAFEGLIRLAGRYSEKERWNQALSYVQRAHRLRPRDPDTLERLFHLYNHLKHPDEARKALRQLRDVRPDDPQYELYELDLIEVRNIGDIDRLLGEIEKVMRRHPQDARVEERAAGMLANLVPLLTDLYDRLADRLSDVVDQVRSLPNYQINWAAVGDEARDLQRDFQKLRRVANRCQPLLVHDEPRRLLRELADRVDRKIDTCRSILR